MAHRANADICNIRFILFLFFKLLWIWIIGHKQLNRNEKPRAIKILYVKWSLSNHSMFHIQIADIATSNICEIGNVLIALFQFQNNFFSFICLNVWIKILITWLSYSCLWTFFNGLNKHTFLDFFKCQIF